MDALDVFRVGAKVGCMVDFVFEKLCELVSRAARKMEERATCDAGDFITNKVRGLIFVVT